MTTAADVPPRSPAPSLLAQLASRVAPSSSICDGGTPSNGQASLALALLLPASACVVSKSHCSVVRPGWTWHLVPAQLMQRPPFGASGRTPVLVPLVDRSRGAPYAPRPALHNQPLARRKKPDLLLVPVELRRLSLARARISRGGRCMRPLLPASALRHGQAFAADCQLAIYPQLGFGQQ